MTTTGKQRATSRQSEMAKAVAILYAHTPKSPETRQVRRAKERVLKKARARADKVAARRARARRT